MATEGVTKGLLALALAECIAAFGAGMIVPLLAPLLAGLDDPHFPETLLGLPVTTELQVGILFAVFGLVRSTFEIPLGRLSDYVGVRKPFLEVGIFTSAVALYLYSTAGTVAALMTIRAFHGFALAISTPALFALIEGITEQRSRGGSMGFFSTIQTLGWGVGPIVGGVIADVHGVEFTFTVGAVIVALAVVAIHVAVPEVRSRDDHGRRDESDDGSLETAPDGGRSFLWVFSTREQAASLLGLAVAMITLMAGFSAMIAMENPILDRIGGTLAGFGVIFAIATITRLFVQFPIGAATDRLGRKRFIIAGLVMNAPLVALMGYSHTLFEFTALRALQGIALAAVIAPTYALAADVVDERRSGEQMAVISTAFSVGLVVGPILAGAVAFLGFAIPFLVSGVLTLLGGILVWLLVDEPNPSGPRDGGLLAD